MVVLHLKQIDLLSTTNEIGSQYPFTVPTIQNLSTLRFQSPITIFVGENGTGKSTLLEALAAAIGSTTVGAESIQTDPTLVHARQFAKYIKLSWNVKTKKGFFLRSEDFFNYVKNINQLRSEMLSYIEEANVQYKNHSILAQQLAVKPYKDSIRELESRYGEDFDANSHGETFFTLFHSRFVPNGLYLLDEPEAALSPMKQLALIALLKDLVHENAQFIIATHSPILMAYPGAQILNFDGEYIRETTFDQLEQVQFMKSFLTNPDSYLRHL